MRWRSVLMLAVSSAAACGIVTAGPAAGATAMASATRSPAAASAWGLARSLPGLGALDRGKAADPEALSCPAAGDCVVGGSYTDASGRTQAFVADESGGRWGRAVEVPGTATLNRGGDAVVTSVSCPAPGDCVAVGRYSPGGTAAGGSGHLSAEAFVAGERGGRWGRATGLPGLAALNKGRSAGADAVSCWSPGDCTVAGSYAVGARRRDLLTQAFVGGERGGRWGRVTGLPHLAALNTEEQAEVGALSCAPGGAGGNAPGGNCAVGGEYGTPDGTEAFVADEVNGAWRRAEEFPGTAARNTAGAARINSISCPSAGDCGAAGSYAYKAGHGTESGTGFVADFRAGTWGAPHKVPGTGDVISCGSEGNCAAGGTEDPGRGGAFVVTEKNGGWGGPRPVPGAAGRGAGIAAISCSPAGYCGAGGSAGDGKRGSDGHAFVVTERGGAWSAARPAPAGDGDSAVTLMSCASPLACTAAGYDDGGSGIFVTSTAAR